MLLCAKSITGILFLSENYLAPTCGGEIEADSKLKFLSSPDWPVPYNKTSECVWHIRADPAMKIRLILLGFITKPNYYNILVII